MRLMSNAVCGAAMRLCGLAVVALGGCGGGDSGNDTPKTPEILYSFGDSSVDSTTPDRGLLKGSDGNFYGATWLDGASGKGAVFKITPTGEKSVLHSFAGGPTDGADPSFPNRA